MVPMQEVRQQFRRKQRFWPAISTGCPYLFLYSRKVRPVHVRCRPVYGILLPKALPNILLPYQNMPQGSSKTVLRARRQLWLLPLPYISCSHRGGHCRAKGTETGDFSLAAFFIVDHILKCLGKMPEL